MESFKTQSVQSTPLLMMISLKYYFTKTKSELQLQLQKHWDSIAYKLCYPNVLDIVIVIQIFFW